MVLHPEWTECNPSCFDEQNRWGKSPCQITKCAEQSKNPPEHSLPTQYDVRRVSHKPLISASGTDASINIPISFLVTKPAPAAPLPWIVKGKGFCWWYWILLGNWELRFGHQDWLHSKKILVNGVEKFAEKLQGLASVFFGEKQDTFVCPCVHVLVSIFWTFDVSTAKLFYLVQLYKTHNWFR